MSGHGSFIIRKCSRCALPIGEGRSRIGLTECLSCGDRLAKRKVYTVAPLHKSNYILISNPSELVGINNKGGNVK